MSSVISKTIRTESPAPKEIRKNNTITLKNSGKAKFNFIELKTCSSKKKIILVIKIILLIKMII